MSAYEQISAFYDAVMDDPEPRAARVNQWIDRYLPQARSLLELGCGTGSILALITSVPSLTGLDQSREMLAVAKTKVPNAQLVEGDMHSFDLHQRFDVVICVFDSLNHLLTFDAWKSTFRAVHDHLQEGGLFIFDVNTIGELRRLGDEPPWVYDFDDGVMIMDVSFAEDERANAVSEWDIRIFERHSDSTYELHHEKIGEIAVSLSEIRSSLRPKFAILEEASDVGDPPTDDSVKAHFACRRLTN